VLRLGYAYNPAPIPDETLTPLIPGTLEHLFTIGYGHAWTHWGLDLAYQYSFGPDRTVDTSDIVGGDFDGATMSSQSHNFFVAVSYRF
jgi:long-subunit fatty acid transport protein